MATQATEVSNDGTGADGGTGSDLAEADACDAVEWVGSGAGGGALDTEISWRTVFSRGECAGGGSRAGIGRDDGDGGAHRNGEAYQPAD